MNNMLTNEQSFNNNSQIIAQEPIKLSFSEYSLKKWKWKTKYIQTQMSEDIRQQEGSQCMENKSLEQIYQEIQMKIKKNNNPFTFILKGVMETLQKQLSKDNYKFGEYTKQYSYQKESDKQLHEENIRKSFRDRDPNRNTNSEKPQLFSPSKHKKQIIKSGTYPCYLEQNDGVYEGDLDMSYKKEGLGIFIADSGEIYIGEWSNDTMHGEGILHFPFGGYLYGNFKENKVHGIAILQLPYSYIYIGYWKQSKLNGKCFELNTLQKEWIYSEYKNGDLISRIQTETAEMTQNGLAGPKFMEPYEDIKFWMNRLSKKLYFSERDINYSQKHLRHMNIEKGLDYVGFVEEKKIPSGLGFFSFDKKIIYGNYKNGVLDGYGRMILDNGDIYDGQFKNGQFNGVGVYYNFENNTYIYAMFHDNNAIDYYHKGINYPADIIQKIRSQNHKYHRRYYSKELHLEKLQILKDFYRKIFDDYEQMYTKASKDNQDVYNLGIVGSDLPEQKLEQKKISNITASFLERIQIKQFGQNNNGLYSPKSENQLDQVNTNHSSSNNVLNLNNIQTTQILNDLSNNKMNNNQQYTNQNIMNQITQQQQCSNSQNVNISPIQNSINAIQNNNQSNNSNSISQSQTLNQQTIPQAIESARNNTQISPKQVLQNSIFSENIVDSPVKGEKKEIKTNLINANAVVNSLPSSTVLKKNEKINETLISSPNITRPSILQNTQQNIAQESFRKELEQKQHFTPYKELENEFTLDETINNKLTLTKVQSQQKIPKYVRQKIFQDPYARPSNSQERLSEISRMRPSHNQSQGIEGDINEFEFYEQEGTANSQTPVRELQRNDTARSTLSQQKYRKNQLLQEINPSKLITSRNSSVNQQGIQILPKPTNQISRNQEQEDPSEYLLNKQPQPSPSMMWAYNPNGQGIVKMNNQSFVNQQQICQELQKSEDTKDQLVYKPQLNDQARNKLRAIILEEAKMNRQRKQQEQEEMQQDLQQARGLSVNQKRQQQSISPMKYNQDWFGKQISFSNNRVQTEQGFNRQNNKENQQQTCISSRQNDIGNMQPHNITEQYQIFKTSEFMNSLDIPMDGSEGNLDRYAQSQMADMIIQQKAKKNIFQPIEQQNFENDRNNSKFFKNEYRLQEQQNLAQSFTPNKKTRKQIFQPIDSKTSVDRFDKINSQFQQILQDDDYSGLPSYRDQENSSFVQLSSPLKKSLNQLHSYQMQSSRIGGQRNNLDSSRAYNHNNSDISMTTRNPSYMQSNNDRLSSQSYYNRPPAGHMRSLSPIQQKGGYYNNRSIQKIQEEEQITQVQQFPQIVINNEREYLNHPIRTITFQN